MNTTFTTEEKTELQELIASGAVTAKKHPSLDLYLYSYTRDYVRTPGEGHWTNELLNQCRGLIATGDGTIVARPFPKFFNYEELGKYFEPGAFEKTVVEKNYVPEIREKIDGSLGILYWQAAGFPALCTRNSWDSEQAVTGTKILRQKYWRLCDKLDPSKTYLFEIVYPENRIIVDYGATEDVFLLAVIDTATGFEYPIGDPRFNPGFPVPKLLNAGNDWLHCRELAGDVKNKEGFVVRFYDPAAEPTSVMRVKMKFKEYFELHFLKGKITRGNILKVLASGDREALVTLLAELEYAQGTQGAEEMQIQAYRIADEFFAQLRTAAEEALKLNHPQDLFESKAQWAEYVKSTDVYAPVLFKLGTGKFTDVESLVSDAGIKKLLWKIVVRQNKLGETDS